MNERNEGKKKEERANEADEVRQHFGAYLNSFDYLACPSSTVDYIFITTIWPAPILVIICLLG